MAAFHRRAEQGRRAQHHSPGSSTSSLHFEVVRVSILRRFWMIPPSFDYAAPKTIPEAVALLGNNPDAKVLAGRHSLIPMMKIRLSSPAMLVDINRIPGLAYIRREGGWLRLGALTREVDLDHSHLIHQKYPLLADTTRMIADPLVRNLATVGGNLA